MIIFLVISIIILVLFFFFSNASSTYYDKKHGMKHTFTDSGITTEMDFQNPLTYLKLLSLFIQGEDDFESRKKYIKQYNRLKNSLEKEGYDLSDFRNYEKDE
mgnify:FL=1